MILTYYLLRCSVNDDGILAFDILRFINRAMSEAVEKSERILEVVLTRYSFKFVAKCTIIIFVIRYIRVSANILESNAPTINDNPTAVEKKSKDAKQVNSTAILNSSVLISGEDAVSSKNSKTSITPRTNKVMIICNH